MSKGCSGRFVAYPTVVPLHEGNRDPFHIFIHAILPAKTFFAMTFFVMIVVMSYGSREKSIMHR
jgi:hypothetical protein